MTGSADDTYGCPPHPAMQQGSDGGWYCTECGARVG